MVKMEVSAGLTVKTFRFGDGDYSVDGGPVSFTMKGDEITADIDLQRRDTPFLAGSIVGDGGTGRNIDGLVWCSRGMVSTRNKVCSFGLQMGAPRTSS